MNGTIDHNVRNSFNHVRKDIEEIKRELMELRNDHKELMDILSDKKSRVTKKPDKC